MVEGGYWSRRLMLGYAAPNKGGLFGKLVIMLYK